MSVPNLSGDTVVLGTEGADLQQFFCLSLIGIASLQPLLSVVAEIWSWDAEYLCKTQDKLTYKQ